MDKFYLFFFKHWMLFFFLVFLLFFIIALEFRFRKKKNDILVKDLVTLLNHERTIILDFRNRKEFITGHIKGSINFSDININENYIRKFKNKNIVFVNCKKFSKMHDYFINNGINKIYNLYNGIDEWILADMPLVKINK